MKDGLCGIWSLNVTPERDLSRTAETGADEGVKAAVARVSGCINRNTSPRNSILAEAIQERAKALAGNLRLPPFQAEDSRLLMSTSSSIR
jgi:hypothetical protein